MLTKGRLYEPSLGTCILAITSEGGLPVPGMFAETNVGLLAVGIPAETGGHVSTEDILAESSERDLSAAGILAETSEGDLSAQGILAETSEGDLSAQGILAETSEGDL